MVRQVVLERVNRDGLDSGLVPFTGGRRPLVVANWKMNLLSDEVRSFAGEFQPRDPGVEVAICPPSVHLAVLRQALGPASKIRLGAQDLHPAPRGAYTGEHAGPMLKDAGASYVIVGHSERRGMGEDDELVRQKMLAALAAGLSPILCVGEGQDDRNRGATLRHLRGQLNLAFAGLGTPAPDPMQLVVAYEPIWAIGTGQTATAGQAQEALGFIRQRLSELFTHAFARRVRLLYGGSATPDNAFSLASQPDLDGFLVGGASLTPGKFQKIVEATGSTRALQPDKERDR